MKAGLIPMGLPPQVSASLIGAAGEAESNRRIREELKSQQSDVFSNAVLRDRIRSIQNQPPPPIRQDAAEPQPGSPRANQANENDPLLQDAEVERVINAAPENARPVLRENRSRIAAMIGNQLRGREGDLQQLAKYAWEAVIAKKIEDQHDPVNVNETRFEEHPHPPHCRVQYFWNEKRQRVERLMVCESDGRKRVYKSKDH